MHELTLITNLIDAVLEHVDAHRVYVVRLKIGRRVCASPHALRFCFQVGARGTPLDGATLEIEETDGDELRIEEVEVE